MPEKNPKVNLGLKNSAMLPSYFDFVHLRLKVRFRPELSPKFLSTLGPNPARTQPDPKSPAQLTTLDLHYNDAQQHNIRSIPDKSTSSVVKLPL